MQIFIICFYASLIFVLAIPNAANSVVFEYKRSPLDKETIEKVVSIANMSPVKFEESDYFEGEKIENYQSFGDYYSVRYYPDSPSENFPGVIRLTEYRIGIGEKSLNSKSCYSQNDQKCEFRINNLVSLENNGPFVLNEKNLSSFINLGGMGASSTDFDDATLAYILRIIRIPLNDIISKNHSEFSLREYEVSQELIHDLKSYQLDGPANHYKPYYVRLELNRTHNQREYVIHFRQKERPYSRQILLFIKKLNIEGTKTSIRIVDGPIP